MRYPNLGLDRIVPHLLVILSCALLTAPMQMRQDPMYLSCPPYENYARRAHGPRSSGPYALPYQRPVPECRLFVSEPVEDYIKIMNDKIVDKDLARLLENCLPNTLDTTIKWHDDLAPQTFIITGDINAEWLRDSTFQLEPYHRFLKHDKELQVLVNGAIQTQATFVSKSPYCNAFQPPRESKLHPVTNDFEDVVHPVYDPEEVFECKYEIDSLSSFLRLSRKYYHETKNNQMFTSTWITAVQRLLKLVHEQSQPSFQLGSGLWNAPFYSFRRRTDIATETLAMNGAGYPVNLNISLVRSAFRPSDDSTVLQFFIPGNAMLSVELEHLSELLMIASDAGIKSADLWADMAQAISVGLRAAILEHGVFEHHEFGKVFAFEIDGYGGRISMDDANVPSLLALPLLEFLDRDDQTYQNTRRLVLSSRGNAHYHNGTKLQGIGSPHTPMKNVWPISLMVQIMTSVDEVEVVSCLKQLLTSTAGLGLMHESINAWNFADFSRPWFAWANAFFALTIMDIDERFPNVLQQARS